MGDHTETIEIDFDPKIISYSDMMDWYFSNSNTCSKSYSTQYDSVIFFRNEEQRIAALNKKEEFSRRYGIDVPVRIEQYSKFYLAETYHQKYFLQLVKDIFDEYKHIYPYFIDFVNSTAAMMINSYVRGNGTMEMLEKDINNFGLSNKAKDALLSIVEGYGK